MPTLPVQSHGLTLQLEEKANETIVHCAGRINAANSEMFQREIRNLIPEADSQLATITCRIVLDLSNVTYVDSSGLGALLGAWTATKNKGCELEMANLNPRVEKLVEITKLDTVFKRARVVAATTSTTATLSGTDLAPVLRPEEAWQQAIDEGMVVHRADPLTCETSIPALIGGVVPNRRFYVRNHFPVPRLDPSSWRLNVVGLVDRPLRLSLRDLIKMPSQLAGMGAYCTSRTPRSRSYFRSGHRYGQPDAAPLARVESAGLWKQCHSAGSRGCSVIVATVIFINRYCAKH